jgi:hypothetical protein
MKCNCPEGDRIKAYNETSGESTLPTVPDSVFLAAELRAFLSGVYLLPAPSLVGHPALVPGVR